MKQAWIILTLVITSPAWANSIIDFEDWTGGRDVQYDVESRGFFFSNGSILSIEPQTGNTTCALHSLSSTLKFADPGETFSIISIDLQEGLGTADSIFITLIGYRALLPSIVQTFTLDGYSNTFETFHPSGFSDLTGAQLYAHNAQGQNAQGFSVDNIIVPEPGVLSVVLFGIGIFARRTPARL